MAYSLLETSFRSGRRAVDCRPRTGIGLVDVGCYETFYFLLTEFFQLKYRSGSSAILLPRPLGLTILISCNPFFSLVAAPSSSCSEAELWRSSQYQKAVQELKKLEENYDFLISEGIGGIMGTVDSKRMPRFYGFYRQMNLPANYRLDSYKTGTQNHTLLTNGLQKVGLKN